MLLSSSTVRMEGEDDRQAKEKALTDTIYPHRNIFGGSIATSQAGESFLTLLSTAATGDLVQGILHVPINIPVNDLMLATLKGHLEPCGSAISAEPEGS